LHLEEPGSIDFVLSPSPDRGRPKAIYEFEVQDTPVTVAVDAKGVSVHNTGPADWEKRIREFKIPVTVA